MTPEEKKKLAWNAALAGISLIPGGVAVSGAAKAAQVGAKALPWLMRARRGLTAGKGVNLPFKKVNRATGTPGTVGVMGGGTRPIPGRPPQGIGTRYRKVPEEQIGTRTVGREGIPAGLLRRKPIRSAGAVGAAAFGGYPLVNQLVGGEDPAVQGVGGAYAPEDPWAAPSDMLGFAEQQEAMAAQGKAQLSQMLKYGFMIAAAGGKPDKFFDRGMKIMEQSQAYHNSKHFADVVRAVYKEGDMPKNAREAYERLVPLLGPEEAQVLSGHQLGMERGKTKDERIWSEIMTLAQSDIEGAAAILVNAWGTGRLKNPPFQTDHKIRMEKAKQMIQAELGSPQLAEGVQNLEVMSA